MVVYSKGDDRNFSITKNIVVKFYRVCTKGEEGGGEIPWLGKINTFLRK